VRANGSLSNWQAKGDTIKLSMNGHQPLELVLDGPGKCRMAVGKQIFRGKQTEEGWLFKISRQNLEGAEVVCR
jgi:hypothetical protein